MKKIQESFDTIIEDNLNTKHVNHINLEGISEDSTRFTVQLLHRVWNERTHYDSVEEALLYIFKNTPK